MLSKIQFRRGLSTSWIASNPVLEQGEPGFEVDTGKFKIGDGTSSWVQLAYAGGDFIEESDPIFSAWDKSTGISITESQISDLGNYLTEETDPVFLASPAAGIETSQISSWDSAYGWGDHAVQGYLVPTINTVSGTTGTVSAGSTASINLEVGKAYMLYKIQTSHAVWVRIYTDNSSRLADAGRTQGQDPGVSSGVIAEAITTGNETVVFSPAPHGFNNESPITNIMPIAVTNLSGTGNDITVTVTKLTLVA